MTRLAASPYENGNYVNRAELAAHLTPMKEDIDEIKGDVKLLLGRSSAADAIARYRRWLIGTAIALVAAVGTVLALMLG